MYSSLIKICYSQNFAPIQPKVFTIDNFKQMIDEPSSKRTKYDTSIVEKVHANNSSSNFEEDTTLNVSNTDTNEILWESNYVSISDVLPCNSLLFVS